jgi:hypothetical protein
MFRTLGSNLNGRCAHTRIIQCAQRPLRLFPNVRNIYYSQSLILINQDRRGRDRFCNWKFTFRKKYQSSPFIIKYK